MKRRLLALARSRPGGWLLRLVLAYYPRALPLERVFDSGAVRVYRHPAPAYPTHFLLIPSPPAADLDAISEAAYIEVVRAAYLLAERESLPAGWRLVANTGRFQDVAVLHFHLILID